MDAAPIRELIQQWRNLSADLKVKNQELEKAREALQELESEHTHAVQQWDLEKEGIKNTISGIVEQVGHKQEELQRIEKESEELQQKVQERRRRNEEHLRVLNQRKAAVEDRVKQADEHDAGVKARLDAFEQSRDTSRQQLLAMIAKLEEGLPRERAGHEQKARQLRSRAAEIEAATAAEVKAWALEQAIEEWNAQCEMRKLLLEEVNAAEEGKNIWAGLLQEVRAVTNEAAMRQKVVQMRASLAV